ncbi:hypothetical protein GIB67_005330 [Kingdonia uniflora]|uniref:Aminotransferase-like plant mobile domain-containing protein n=1 Tax=Kingdonia uniflora TaxID=39325 RepID=A0A7J7NCI6_9MAGN|nr:hypothetical protein GIB67_005330 [Kingdonia uniflora]
MNQDNVEVPPMSEEPQTEEPGCLRVHHHAPTWHLDKEPTIVQDLVMLAGLDRISEISYEHYNAGLISVICEHWQPETNTFHLSWGEITLSLDDVQHLIGNSLSLVKLVNFYAGKLEKYNDSIQNKMPDGQKKKDKVNIKWSWGFAVLAHLFHNLGAASRTCGKQFAAYTTLLESWIFAHFPKLHGIPKEQQSDAPEYCTRWKWGLSITERTGARELLKYREAFDNYKVEDVSNLPILCI